MMSRAVDELIESAHRVIHLGYCHGGLYMAPLFSGGHDSLCAVHLASQHPKFGGEVHHIDTGIGAEYTRRFVERVCDSMGWNLKVWKSPATYEEFVGMFGFPGPGMHQYVYNILKDRCVGFITKGRAARLLINGARIQESVRRMGSVEPVKMGEDRANGKRVNRKRIWTAPCHDWSKAEQMAYMDEFGLPTNKLKVAVGLSGECFCGAFAAPGERELVREHAPDVEAEIVRLTQIAKDCGKPCEWGQRPNPGTTTVSETGPLCSSCDRRAASAGIIVSERI